MIFSFIFGLMARRESMEQCANNSVRSKTGQSIPRKYTEQPGIICERFIVLLVLVLECLGENE
jgi:hypothetical protein